MGGGRIFGREVRKKGGSDEPPCYGPGYHCSFAIVSTGVDIVHCACCDKY